MAVKIINRIFLRIIKNNLNNINHRSIKKFKVALTTRRVFTLLKRYRLRKRRRRGYVFTVRRRWRKTFYRRRFVRTYKRRYIKRRLRRFRLKTIIKIKHLNKITKLFLFIFYFRLEHNLSFFFLLLYRFALFKFKSRKISRRRRYFTRGRYVFENMLARTFLRRGRGIIVSIGKKKYIPYGYNPYPLKISVFSSIKKKSFYTKIKLLGNNSNPHPLLLLKNFKKSNLFVKNNITNTDFFVKLNTRNRNYNLFSSPTFKKLSLQKKVNITSRQITVLKQARLRVYNFYFKKSRNYKITKFFLKLGNSVTLLNWLVNWEFKLINIILRSKLSRNYSQALILIKNNYVFINGLVNNDINYIVATGDLIQVPINTQWFLRDRLQTSFFNKFLKDLNKYTKKNHLLSNRYFFKFYKKEHSWLVENLRNFSKTPTYMEVDYSTLSIVIIKKTINSTEALPIYTNTFKPLTVRLYNWRYFY